MSTAADNLHSFEIRRIAPGDGKGLARFYRGLSRASRKKLTPLGLRIDRNTCEFICFDNFLGGADKYDLILLQDREVVGWCFLWGIRGSRPSLGLAIADAFQGKGLGRRMMDALLAVAREAQVPAIYLTVESDNVAARGLYESLGFVTLEAASEEAGCVDMRLDLQKPAQG